MTIYLNIGLAPCPKCGKNVSFEESYLGSYPPDYPMEKRRTQRIYHCKCDTPLTLYLECTNHVGETLEMRVEEWDHVEQTLVSGDKIYTLCCPDCKTPFPKVYGVKE